MEKVNDDQDLYLKLFENKMNSNLFKFLVREYFSNSMNPFLILKMLSKILFSNISKFLKLKYIHFFLTILKRLTINEKLLKEHINPIIADTFEHILTRKADYVIIVQYAIFLVQIGQIDFALSRLQIFSTDLRFINNGELVFYRGLIDYVDATANSVSKETYNKTFLSFFHKSLTLLKKKDKEYGEFIIDFLVSKNMLQELKEFLKHDKIKEIFDKTDKKKFRILNILADSEFMDLFRKISIVSEELDKNFTEFPLLLKFCDLVDNYYDEKMITANVKNSNYDVDMIKCEDENLDENFNNDSDVYCSKSFAGKVAYIGNKHLIIYLKFLSAFILFDPYNTRCLTLLKDVLNYLKFQFSDFEKIKIIKREDETENEAEIDHQLSKDEEIIKLHDIVKENNCIFVEFLLKQVLIRDILKLHKKIEFKSASYKMNNETNKNLNENFFLEFSKKIQNFRLLLDIIDLNNELLTGNKISKFDPVLMSPLCIGFFDQPRRNLNSWAKLIKKIKVPSSI